MSEQITQQQRVAGAEALAYSAERQLREAPVRWRKDKPMLAFMESQAARLRHRATGIAEGWWTSEMEAASHVSFA
jgi:hypothetical protein